MEHPHRPASRIERIAQTRDVVVPLLRSLEGKQPDDMPGPDTPIVQAIMNTMSELDDSEVDELVSNLPPTAAQALANLALANLARSTPESEVVETPPPTPCTGEPLGEEIPAVRVARRLHSIFGDGVNQIMTDVEKTLGVAGDILLADDPLAELKKKFREG